MVWDRSLARISKRSESNFTYTTDNLHKTMVRFCISIYGKRVSYFNKINLACTIRFDPFSFFWYLMHTKASIESNTELIHAELHVVWTFSYTFLDHSYNKYCNLIGQQWESICDRIPTRL